MHGGEQPGVTRRNYGMTAIGALGVLVGLTGCTGDTTSRQTTTTHPTDPHSDTAPPPAASNHTTELSAEPAAQTSMEPTYTAPDEHGVVPRSDLPPEFATADKQLEAATVAQVQEFNDAMADDQWDLPYLDEGTEDVEWSYLKQLSASADEPEQFAVNVSVTTDPDGKYADLTRFMGGEERMLRNELGSFYGRIITHTIDAVDEYDKFKPGADWNDDDQVVQTLKYSVFGADHGVMSATFLGLEEISDVLDYPSSRRYRYAHEVAKDHVQTKAVVPTPVPTTTSDR